MMKVFVAILLSLITPVTLAASEIVIKELADIDFGQVPPTSGTQTLSATFCVGLDENGRYSVTGSGSGPGFAFMLQNSSNYSAAGLSYDVFVNDRGQQLGHQLEPLVPVSGLRGKRIGRNQRCPRPPARISVRIMAADLQAARPGRYRGTLSLMVVPE